MVEIGRFQELRVVKKVSFGLYLGPEDDAILLPRKYVPEGTEVGDRVRVFVYHDSEDRPVATTAPPRAALDEIAAMEVVDETAHGVFVDWGLEKDLFVPSKEQHQRMPIGSVHVVWVCLDERTGRLIGSTRLGAYFDRDLSHLEPGREVSLLVWGRKDVGALVVVDGRFAGMVYDDAGGRELRQGSAATGYIDRVRDDGKVDVSLRKRGRAAQLEGQREIVRALEASAEGFLPLHDKSPAEEIQRHLAMSKKVFKAALGGLYKQGVVVLEEGGIRLAKTAGQGDPEARE